MRIGSGHDSHRLIIGRPLILGGMTIPHTHGLDGHSDADVLLHAITDAILGAIGAGDIGEQFPDTDPQWKDASSTIFLKAAERMMTSHGYRIGNLDATIFAEAPKLGPHKQLIRNHVAGLLGMAPHDVSIKAKTGERVGPIGRGEAIACHAVVLLQKN